MISIDQATDIIAMVAPELAGVEITAGIAELPAAAVAVHGVAGAAGPSIIFRGEPSIEHLVHEMAHLLPITAGKMDDHPTPAVSQWYLQRAVQTEPMTDGDLPWAGGHDLAFVRRCCHLVFRAAELKGISTVDTLARVRSGNTCYLNIAHIEAVSWACHGLDDYLAALGWEPRRCRTWRFADIERLEMPEPFQRLFVQDQHTWLQETHCADIDRDA